MIDISLAGESQKSDRARIFSLVLVVINFLLIKMIDLQTTVRLVGDSYQIHYRS